MASELVESVVWSLLRNPDLTPEPRDNNTLTDRVWCGWCSSSPIPESLLLLLLLGRRAWSLPIGPPHTQRLSYRPSHWSIPHSLILPCSWLVSRRHNTMLLYLFFLLHLSNNYTGLLNCYKWKYVANHGISLVLQTLLSSPFIICHAGVQSKLLFPYYNVSIILIVCDYPTYHVSGYTMLKFALFLRLL